MKTILLPIASATAILAASAGVSFAAEKEVSDDVIAAQRAALETNTAGAGFGPQSPRDIDAVAGTNDLIFQPAPASTEMNLCNIHFHENAEHRGGQFRSFAGNGDGKGYGTGFKYSGELTAAELAPVGEEYGVTEHGSLVPGDTIEVHYVHTTARVEPGPSLGACLSDAIMNPQLRVEAQVFVLVNDQNAADFGELVSHKIVNGLHQAPNIPSNTGEPVQYAGSTTGPSYNEKGSPLQVSWSVRPEVIKVDVRTVGAWLADNTFKEDHAHGVRNLVENPNLLSKIGG